MKIILTIFFLIFFNISNSNAEVSTNIKRIMVGDENAKITIIAYESLTCSHCANFHINIYPELKKNFIDKGYVKIEFRHFPLDVAALNAAKITQCNNENSSKILESLYSNQSEWVKGKSIEDVNENLKKFLASEGFEINFTKCTSDKSIEDYVLNDRI